MNNLSLLSTFESSNFSTQNRVVLAPLTRRQATQDQVPTYSMLEFYVKRASAGLLIAEACSISNKANCYPHTPGIYSQIQCIEWKKITSAVKENKGGLFFLQLWHPGMMGHRSISGRQPLSPSGVKPKRSLAPIIHLPYEIPKAMTSEDFKNILKDFQVAAKNSLEAGFDGIELHGAYGYLLSSFLHHESNLRSDEYGGTSENMSRFPLEVVDAMIEVMGDSKKVAIRISPVPPKSMESFDPHPKDEEVYAYFLQQLSLRNLAYVHCASDDDEKERGFLKERVSQFTRKHFQGTLITGGNYSIEEANEAVRTNKTEFIYFGKFFFGNPDLVDVIEKGNKPKAFSPSMIANPL